VEKDIDSVVELSDTLIQSAKCQDYGITPPPNHPVAPVPFMHSVHLPQPPPGVFQCARVLQQRCPACFAGSTFGRSFDKYVIYPTFFRALTTIYSGADFHIAADGNFHHRHRRTAGDSPHFYDPDYFISKEKVDDVGHRIDTLRKTPAKRFHRRVPDEAVDECEKSHEAADGRKQKANMDKFDDTGVMALVCRHDIPLFFTNIDTPGEQQKYSVALLKHFFTHIPKNATVACLYDIGCVLDRSLQLVSYPPSDIRFFSHHIFSMIYCLKMLWAGSFLLPVPCTRMDTNGPASLSTTHAFAPVSA
jgi:hypothetical protein